MSKMVKSYGDKIKLLCANVAKEMGVVNAVHPEDLIFQFCLEHDCFSSEEEAVKYYFWQGLESAKKLSFLMEKHLDSKDKSPELLEFASGFGAVTRHLVKVLPAVNITACDIHEKAVEFIKENLSTNAVLSSHLPESLELPKKYDVVFALSFFSHMPRETWGRWLQALSRLVEAGGLLIFTTHGEVSRKHFAYPEMDKDGFWFKAVSEQKDLDVNEYGMTVTLKKFVQTELNELENFDLCFYEEAFWWEHQDVYVLKRQK
ncbi:MAG: methyltransferase [Deltaproteobacteria bacterium]|nr:methyltransferase [Deltaproteobacteria bacterium]